MKRRSILPALLTLVAISLGGCGLDDDPPPPPDNQGPLVGSIWTETDLDTVAQGGNVQVSIYVNAGDDVMGCYSLHATYNQADFSLQSVTKGSTLLGDPLVTDTAPTGSVFVSAMNQADPNEKAVGVQEILILTFRADGSAGGSLNFQGQLLNLADTRYPAQDLGHPALPRDMTVQAVAIE
jgi:hypothetical protein